MKNEGPRARRAAVSALLPEPACEEERPDDRCGKRNACVPAPRASESDTRHVPEGEAEKEERTDPLVFPRDQDRRKEDERGDEVHGESDEHYRLEGCGEDIECEEGEEKHESDAQDPRQPVDDLLSRDHMDSIASASCWAPSSARTSNRYSKRLALLRNGCCRQSPPQ